MTDQPRFPEIEEHERTEAVRRRLVAERCQHMERALLSIGFSPGTWHWAVALLIARISDGWRPLVRSRSQLAADSALPTSSSDLANRKRMMDRTLAELERYGLIEVAKKTGGTRRRTRPEMVYMVTCNRAAIMGEIPFCDAVEIEDRDTDNGVDNEPDNGVDTSRTTEWTTSGTEAGQRSGQIENSTVLVFPYTQDPSIPDGSDEWAAVVDLILSLGSVRLPTAWADGLDAARRSSVGADYVRRVIEHYAAAGSAYRPGALVQRLRRSHPSVPPESGWPEPVVASIVPVARELTEHEIVARLEREVIVEGRRRRLTDSQIGEVIGKRLDRAEIHRSRSRWCVAGAMV